MLPLSTSHLRLVNSWHLRLACLVLDAFLEPLIKYLQKALPRYGIGPSKVFDFGGTI